MGHVSDISSFYILLLTYMAPCMHYHPGSASQIHPLQHDPKRDNILAVLPQTGPATLVTQYQRVGTLPM